MQSFIVLIIQHSIPPFMSPKKKKKRKTREERLANLEFVGLAILAIYSDKLTSILRKLETRLISIGITLFIIGVVLQIIGVLM